MLTNQHKIECEPTKNDNKKLSCKVNNEEITQEKQYQQIQNNIVEYNNEEQTSVDINIDGVRVQFLCICSNCQCQKATVKLPELYKNTQCGLCSHYNDESSNKFRMSNNEETEDLLEFHRSYSLKDNEECTAEKQNAYYNTQHKQNEMNRRVSSEENWDQSLKENMQERKNMQNKLSKEEINMQWQDDGYASDNDDNKYLVQKTFFESNEDDDLEKQKNNKYKKYSRKDLLKDSKKQYNSYFFILLLKIIFFLYKMF